MIGIDISTTSTGITVIDKKGDVYHYNITDKITKYHKNSDCIETLYVEKIEKTDCYSENERNKFIKYKKICNFVEEIINHDVDNIFNIEGFSYSSNAGAIIDIVMLSSLIRNVCYSLKGSVVNIISPTSLKKFACDNAHLKTKFDMKDKLIEKYPELKLVNELKLLPLLKTVPSPYADVVDSFWLAKYV